MQNLGKCNGFISRFGSSYDYGIFLFYPKMETIALNRIFFLFKTGF